MHKKSTLFTKLFLMQVVVALITILLIIPTIFVLVGDYFVGSQKGDILQEAQRVATLSEKILEIGDNASVWNFYKMTIDHAGQGSMVLVLNANGEIVAAPNNTPYVNKEYIGSDFIDPVRDGHAFTKLYGKGKMFSEQMLAGMAPIMKTDAVTGKRTFIGAAVVLRAMPQINKIRASLTNIIFFAQLVSWFMAFIISSLLTRQITNPIKKMRNAAKSIAAGNFNERIPITSNDEIGQLAESFNQMTRSLSELEIMRSSFVSDVSHELRTPMTIISGFVEGIVDGTIPESEHGKYLNIVLSETKRLSRLVTELLEASRLEQGKVVLNKESIDMNRMVTESIITYEQRLTEKNIDVNLDLDGSECCAFADRDSIKRVLINLIDNAIKFTPEGGRIRIRTEHAARKVRVTVENTGAGISPEDLNHIWERFYKTDKSRGMDKKGVGLGLHIVKTIIMQHGGEINAESVEGEYARFIFTLDECNKGDAVNEKRKDDKNES